MKRCHSCARIATVSQPLQDTPSTEHSGQDLQYEFSTHFRALSNATNGSLRCQSCLVSHQDVVFTRGIVVFFSGILGCLHFPEGFCFLGLLSLLNPTAILFSL